MISSGWQRVAQGLQKVATAAAQQSAQCVEQSATQVAHHGHQIWRQTVREAPPSVRVDELMQRASQMVKEMQGSVPQLREQQRLTPMPPIPPPATRISPTDASQSTQTSKALQQSDFGQMESSVSNSERNTQTTADDLSQSAQDHVPILVTARNGNQSTQLDVPADSVPSEGAGTLTKPNTPAIGPDGQDATTAKNFADVLASSKPIRTTTTRSPNPAGKGGDNRKPNTDNVSEEQIKKALLRLRKGSAVPSSRIGRAWGFAQLGLGLAAGTARSGISRILGNADPGTAASSNVVNDANADLLAAYLCRMRGAALKMGQMLSIQDETLLPRPLARALATVRQGADAMPAHQLHQQLESQLGLNWRDRFINFEDAPFAAASIGQVHRAQMETNSKSNLDVVVKVQYPGVAESIQSDLRNLSMLVQWTGLTPKGLFLDNVIRVGTKELEVECDYLRESKHQRRFQQLVHNDAVLQQNNYVVPDVIDDLTTKQVLTTAFHSGGTIDHVMDLNQDERNRIGRAILYLTIQELFVWRFMQTDPNWGNFLYDVYSRRTTLIDFGATREYSKEFVDGYLRIVWASANRDKDMLMEQSYRMKFLTGNESDQMLHAHQQSGFTVGEPFHHDGPFDFRGSHISSRMGEHTSVFLQHRLTAPPEEVYTLHRKLAGAYMLCIKLGATVRCRDMLQEVVENHDFEDGLPRPSI